MEHRRTMLTCPSNLHGQAFVRDSVAVFASFLLLGHFETRPKKKELLNSRR